jgi:hypothetical protein
LIHVASRTVQYDEQSTRRLLRIHVTDEQMI